MSAMADMSRAIRHVIEDHTPPGYSTLARLPDEALDEFIQIIGAFYLDLKDELARRNAAEEVTS